MRDKKEFLKNRSKKLQVKDGVILYIDSYLLPIHIMI